MNSKLFSKTHLISPIIFLFFIWSCAPRPKTEEKEIPIAKIEGFNVENGKYYNSELGLDIDIPKDWFVLSQQGLDSMIAKMKEEAIKKDPSRKEIIEASDIGMNYLLQTFKYPLETSEKYNPSIAIFVEDVTAAPDIHRGTDYLAYLRRSRSNSAVLDFMQDGFTLKTFSNRDFYFMNASQKLSDYTIYQKYYAVVINRSALAMVVSYSTEEEGKEIDKILETINFEK
ncbi:hypothetical protein ACE193_20620 [Bernardetia sp. OM2101]|uniref:hypothetical protein n=1 Tax=Bernardetia sp. OM2101 TaxID=3344876 RepID=UPI0035D0A590